jgi:polyhydroxyalkanoate synthesis repressor PhaR
MTRLIKKYKNRRLYDSEKSQYITVEDLQRYVIEGLPFKVEDSVTKQDITTATLLQIFVEMEAGPTTFLSPEVLRHLICLAHHPMSQSLKMVLEQMVSAVEKQSQANVFEQSAEALNKQMQQMLHQWQTFFR